MKSNHVKSMRDENINFVKNIYKSLEDKLKKIHFSLGDNLTLTEKILYSHLSEDKYKKFVRGSDYVYFKPDRIACQDATAQMVLLQFMQAGKAKTEVPTTVHCDHLIQASLGADIDLKNANKKSKEVFDFLSSASSKYGIGFWKPGSGIIHQVVLENYAFPGGMMIGTDSHTVNAGGMGMIAIGVGGADAVDVMVGIPWELKFPEIIGVNLKNKLDGWASPKDIILKISGMLTVKGGTGYILEYFGEGAESLSCTGKSTICNMGAEIGATTSIFNYDESIYRYLKNTFREDIADISMELRKHLRGDEIVYKDPHKYFDKVIEIDLAELKPHINGPFTPDLATPIDDMARKSKEMKWPQKIESCLIGSCTNSSYEDISRSVSIIKQAIDNDLELQTELNIIPGSEQIRYTIERDGYIDILKKIGVNVFANACGPCIGQWNRQNQDEKPNSIIHSFNRNFSKRNDGNPNTHAFVSSPEIVTAIALSGRLDFNPITDTLTNKKGKQIKLEIPDGLEFSKEGFDVEDLGYQAPAEDGENIKIIIKKDSERLQELKPFDPWNGKNIKNMKLLIKIYGKCTTDHISMAGKWLRYRGHLDNISNNCFITAINYFNKEMNLVKNQLTSKYGAVPDTQREYKKNNIPTIVVGDHNYGEGSSREHAAMEPRFLGVRIILVKSFARIHETNLKKQGMLALTFANEKDYDVIGEDDTFESIDLDNFRPKHNINILLTRSDGSKHKIECKHTYNENQIEWFKHGSALNLIKKTS